ncbi:oligosaccharide flippase family protein [Campylobacter ureolyticus]|uniref:oligosaccharide flippase family protein n=1 Tax=Campylobacter ureolyticus TaxID=827 RepID=UPI00215A8A95|nr:oligosaccharide flippase family protein [Campylobacter ureolyticus]MCR8699098.1 oligosaccharide flippase family protein [Campylobacter ureolyticus]
MSDLKRFVKSSGIYFLGSILSKLIAFFMLPIYTKYLSPSEFGEYDLNLAYMQFFTSFFFLDIYIGMMKFLLDSNLKETKNYKEKVLFSGFFIFFISTLIYFLFFYIFMQIYDIKFKLIILFLGIFLTLQIVYGYICRAYGKNSVFVISGVVSSILYAIVSFTLLYKFDFGYEALLLGALLGNLVAIFIMECRVKVIKKIKLALFDFVLFKKLLYYSLPLCLNSLSYWFAAIYGRSVLANKLSYADNGYYAIALKFALIISLVTTCFKFAWQEVSFSKDLKKQNNSIFYSRACNEYLKFMLLSVAVLLPIIKIIFPFFINSSFNEALIYIPLTLLGAIVFGFSEFLMSIINTINKNKYLFIATACGAILNIILLYLFIYKFGVFTVAFSYIMCYSLVCFIMVLVINKTFKLNIKMLNIMLYLFILLIQSYIMIKCDNYANIISFIVICLLFLLFYKNETSIIILKLKQRFFI